MSLITCFQRPARTGIHQPTLAFQCGLKTLLSFILDDRWPVRTRQAYLQASVAGNRYFYLVTHRHGIRPEEAKLDGNREQHFVILLAVVFHENLTEFSLAPAPW